jgi:hypothetical protein
VLLPVPWGLPVAFVGLAEVLPAGPAAGHGV